MGAERSQLFRVEVPNVILLPAGSTRGRLPLKFRERARSGLPLRRERRRIGDWPPLLGPMADLPAARFALTD